MFKLIAPKHFHHADYIFIFSQKTPLFFHNHAGRLSAYSKLHNLLVVTAYRKNSKRPTLLNDFKYKHRDLTWLLGPALLWKVCKPQEASGNNQVRLRPHLGGSGNSAHSALWKLLKDKKNIWGVEKTDTQDLNQVGYALDYEINWRLCVCTVWSLSRIFC